MGKKTLVRIPKGIVLTETMKTNLQKIFQQDFETEYYTEMPDLQDSYLRRRDSLYDAFKFIIKSIPPQVNIDGIDQYLDWCKAQCALSANLSIEEYQASLSRYTALLSNALIDYWIVPTSETQKKHDAIALLNKAEQYVIMQNGRPDLATISTLDALKNGEFVVQWDRQLPPCTVETLHELNGIKSSKFYVTPQWFRELPFDQQLYLHDSESHRKTTSLLKTDLNALELKWKNIKTDNKTTLVYDLAQIAERKKPLPQWFTTLSDPHRALIQHWASLKIGPIEIDNRFREMGKLLLKLRANHVEQLDTLRKLPQWFLVTPEHEQYLLKATLRAHKNIDDAVSFIPSRLRSAIPGLPNFAEHHLLLTSRDLDVLHRIDPRLRASHICSRDVKNQPAMIGDFHSTRNLKHVIDHADKKPLNIQTLISPFAVLDSIIPDGYLYNQLCRSVALLLEEHPELEIDLTNHPFNIAKYLTMTLTGNIECNALLQRSEKWLTRKSIEQVVHSSGIVDVDFLIGMISDGVTFTRENKDVKGYAELLILLRKNPIFLHNISLGKFKRLVNSAYIEAGIMVSIKADLPPFIAFGNDEEALVTHNLREFFLKHYNILSKWKGWQAVFTNYHCVLTDKVHSEKMLQITTRFCDLAQINCQYQDLLASGYGTGTVFDRHGRELWLSSLENIQSDLRGGKSFGTCVSGKDRKALELIHTDAMYLYRIIYGKWPNICDTGVECANFVELVAHFYLSRQVHEHADQNAPGANGIKTPYKYYPADICAAITAKAGPRALVIDDIMATNNEVDRIGTARNLLQPNYATCVISALKLRENSQEALWDVLKVIFEERSYWDEKKSYSLNIWSSSPSGIGKIKGGLHSPEVTTVESIANIYAEIHKRPEASYWRADETQELYTCIRTLYNAAEPEALVSATLKKLEDIRQKISASTCNY